jgi:F-type H+-transporting ATPase subunit gamma
MEMVATTKLRRLQERATASRPYTQEIQELIQNLAQHVGGGSDRPLFTPRDKVERTGLLLVTSDRGLCGSYNSNVLIQLWDWIDQQTGKQPVFFVYGKKGYAHLLSRKREVERWFHEPSLEKIAFRDAAIEARTLVEAYTKGSAQRGVDEVSLLYTQFVSMARIEATVEPLLPLTAVGGEPAARTAAGAAPAKKVLVDYLLEPSPEVIFDHLVPRYLETKLFSALLQSVTSEYAARRMAMKNATDAATSMTKRLRRTYNRVRQESITKELLDIVGGAEAVR